MKITFYSLIACMTFAFGAIAQEKTAVCNMRQVAESYPGFAALRSTSSSSERPYAKELSLKQNEVGKLQQAINTTPDPAKRLQLVEQLRKLKNDIQASQANAQQSNSQTGMAMRMQVLNAVKSAVAQVAKKDGYSRVYDSGAVLYTDGSDDITAEVIKIVAGAKPVAAGAASASSSVSPTPFSSAVAGDKEQ